MGFRITHCPVVFGALFCLFTLFQVSVGVYIAGVLTTVEKQYRITSTVSGLLLSISDFASMLSTMTVTYLCKDLHRPRIVGVLAILTGLGGIISGVPHFLYPAYPGYETGPPPTGNETSTGPTPDDYIFMCDPDRDEETCPQGGGSRLNDMWALFLGQALMGLAYGPLFPIGLTYLDDQVKGSTTPYYLAAILTAGTTATLVGFGQAAIFLRQYVEWPKPFLQDREYLGAWWMGFILTGVIILIIAIPFFIFPKEMDVRIKEEDVSKEKAEMENEGRTSQLGMTDFLSASKRLFANAAFVSILFGSILDLAVAASFGFFLAKFLEVEYEIAPELSALLVGAITTPAALLGNLTSGVFVKKLNLSAKGCGLMVILLSVISACILPGVFFVKCEEPNHAGLSNGRINTQSLCNDNCTCSGSRYVPVCGADDMVYANPCFAGCTDKMENTTDVPGVNITIYTGCKCSTGGNLNSVYETHAVEGNCHEPCTKIYLVSSLLFVMVLLGSMTKNPTVMMTIRCVGNDKTYALGTQTQFARALGFLPAPLYFGAIIAGTCILDRVECGQTGDCLVYDQQQFRINFLSIFFALSITSILFYIVATVILHRSEKAAKAHEVDTKELEMTGKQNGVDGKYNKGYQPDDGGDSTRF